MARKIMDCREVPSERGCTLTIAGEEEDVLRAAVMHAATRTVTRTRRRSASSYAPHSRRRARADRNARPGHAFMAPAASRRQPASRGVSPPATASSSRTSRTTGSAWSTAEGSRRTAICANSGIPVMSAGSHRCEPSETVMKNQCWAGLNAIFAMLPPPDQTAAGDADALDARVVHDEPRAKGVGELVRRERAPGPSRRFPGGGPRNRSGRGPTSGRSGCRAARQGTVP